MEDYQNGVPVEEMVKKYHYAGKGEVYWRVMWLKNHGYTFEKNRVVEKRKQRCGYYRQKAREEKRKQG